jgi:uncharacterized protein GlcG (DUF336 family)
MIERRSLGLEPARKLLDAVLREAERDRKAPVAVAVVDDVGDLLAFARMNGVKPISISIARRKAYTAAMQREDSALWAAQVKAAGRSATDFGDPELIPFQGGLVIQDGGQTLGAVGVSGRTSQEDEDLARAGVRAIIRAEGS